MRILKIAAAALGLVLASPGIAAAQEGLAAGAITGALTGGLVGGPIGAAIGGLAGAAIGGAAEADYSRQQSVRAGPDYSSVTRPYPRQRAAETDRRRVAPPSSHRHAVASEPAMVQRRQLASAVGVMERTCVRDRAGNQTCREVIR